MNRELAIVNPNQPGCGGGRQGLRRNVRVVDDEEIGGDFAPSDGGDGDRIELRLAGRRRYPE